MSQILKVVAMPSAFLSQKRRSPIFGMPSSSGLVILLILFHFEFNVHRFTKGSRMNEIELIICCWQCWKMWCLMSIPERWIMKTNQ